MSLRYPADKGKMDRIGEGVWLLRGSGLARLMNVFLIEEKDGGVTLFDAGTRSMSGAISAAADALGGLKRIVLSHAHPDHRGAAPALEVPILCHPDERSHAEGPVGQDYFQLSKLTFPARTYMAMLLRRWDGGPVTVASTLAEDDEVAGFRVLHLPGHAPGLICLWRERDRLALASDLIYTLDPLTGRKGPARMARAAFNWDEDQARESVLKLAAMNPATVWPGHADPMTGDPGERLVAVAHQPIV